MDCKGTVLLVALVVAGCAPAQRLAVPSPEPQAASAGDSRSEPNRQLPPEASPEELLARAIIDELGALRFEQVAARFAPSLRARLNAPALAETWRAVIGKAGVYRSTGAAHSEQRADSKLFYVRTLFARAELETLIALDSSGRITGVAIRPVPTNVAFYAPAYVDQSRFREQEIRVPDPEHFCGTGTCGLPGTLSLPNGAGPFPAVVLLHGSGPQDRDQTLGESRPFRDLAWGLASFGIAVLRYEKRTHFLRGRLAPEQIEALTVQQEYVQDARSAVELLRQRSDVARRQLFLLGYSQGATVLPRLAAADSELAGFISLAGPLRPLEDVVLDQVRFLARLDGKEDPRESSELRRLETQVARVKTLTPAGPALASDLPLALPQAYWLDLAAHPPAALLSHETRPFLVLQGERDYQVTLADFAVWKRLLARAPRARFKTYPTLNHLFVAGHGPILPQEYLRPGHVHAEVVRDIAAFVHESSDEHPPARVAKPR
ncbi:MAG TPA: hypothetical protein VER33_21835 [Polyangiaceae bacterium]|nr:hypothetical protein [Polyangiaceae bacterium]